MKRFFDLKIRTKLIICFIVLAAVNVTVGSLGIISLNRLNTNSKNMYNNNTRPIVTLLKIQAALQDVRSNHIMALYEQNPDTLQDKLDAISELAEQTNVLLNEYKEMNKDEQATALYDNLMESLDQYRILRNEHLNLIMEKNYEEAMSSITTVTQAREVVHDDLDALIAYNTQLSEKVLQENDESFQIQLTMMIGIISVTGVFALIMGVIISTAISKPVVEIEKAADQIAKGDLNVSVRAKYKDEIGSLALSFEQMLTSMNDVLSNVAISSEQVDTGAKQVSDAGIALSQGATEQASSVEQLTASLEEISSQTKLNAQSAVQANDLAVKVKENADQGNIQMRDMVMSMESISISSANISNIIKVIDDIAFQTNILALNAAVEAARAGQHGKGFAVVAEEVRNLAARSAKAAKETTALIEDCIKKTEGGTKMAHATAAALNMIVSGVDQVANLISNIAVSSNEQAMGIEQINLGLIQVSQVVQTNSATSEESAAASQELASQANVLKDLVSRFKLRQLSDDYRRNSGMMEANWRNNLNPEVVNMLASKKKGKSKTDHNTQRAGSEKPRIVLGVNDFGKY